MRIFGLLFSMTLTQLELLTDNRKTSIEDFAQYPEEYAYKVRKTPTNQETKIDKLYKIC